MGRILNNKVLRILLVTVMGLLMIGSLVLLYINYKSLKIQRIVKQETLTGKLSLPSDYIIKSFPDIPNITIVAEPVAVQKARYLMNENKFDEARKILRNDHSNPYDGRKEYFIANSFYKEKQFDSAIFYSKQCSIIKPRFYNNLTILASSYEHKGDFDSSLKLWEEYFTHSKDSSKVWRTLAVLNERLGHLEKAEKIVDSAKILFPQDTLIAQVYNSIKSKVAIGSYQNIFNNAQSAFVQKKYSEALSLFNEFISKSPDFPKAYEYRAFCYYHTNQYKKSLEDLKKLQTYNYTLNPNIINLIGVVYFKLNNREQACEYFTRAKNLNDKDGINNYKKFCEK